MDSTTLIVGDIEELSQQANIPRQLRQPPQPTQQEQEEHRITHMPYRSWCPICVKAEGQPTHPRRGALKEQSLTQQCYGYIKSNNPSDKKVHTILAGVETTTGLCLALPKKFVMENGSGQWSIQVDNEQATLQLAQQAAQELTIPWRTYSTHAHQGQGAVERFHKTLFAQVRAIRFYLVDKYNLGSPDNAPEQLITSSGATTCLLHSQ
eukprot:3355548-Amphidinium_carterae.1